MTDVGQNTNAPPASVEHTEQSPPQSSEKVDNGPAAPVDIVSPADASVDASSADAESQVASQPAAPSPAAPIPELPTLTGDFGRYRIARCLGQSPGRATYQAVNTEGEKTVVLKTARFAADDTGAADAFHQTAKVIAQIEHRNVCPVLDDGIIDGVHYYARTYVEGQPLSDFVNPPKPPPARQVAILVRKIAAALAKAHRQGTIHGDLRPANIIIDVQREPNLTNFADEPMRRAKRQPSSATSVALQESWDYLAPEQSDETLGPVGPPTDMYPLGVILYELLTGRRPFVGSPAEVAAQKLGSDPQMPSRLRNGLHPSLDLICLKLLQKQPNRRYATVEEVVIALDDFLQVRGAGSTHSELAMMSEFYRACDTFDARDAEMERHRQRINDLLAEHKYGAAEQLLTRITTFQDPALSDFVDWAKKQLPIVRAMPQKKRAEAVAAYRVAVEMVEHFEYDQAVKLLRSIHPKFLDDRTAELLRDAVHLNEEVELLTMGLDVAEQANRLKNMRPQVERLLELKPNSHTALRIRRELKSAAKRGVVGSAPLRPTRRKPTNRPFMVVMGILGVVILLMAVLLVTRLDFSHGTIAVSIDNPRTTILIDGNRISNEMLDRPILLTRGTHELLVIRDDGQEFQREFNVGWGKNRPLLIEVGGRREYRAPEENPD